MSMSQKEAVFTAVTTFFGSRFVNGMEVKGDDRKAIIESLIASFTEGKWTIESEQSNLRQYVSGLLTNHLLKDSRLNGGKKYTPANPGAKTGSTDETIKNFRAVKTVHPELAEEMDKLIAQRQLELKAEKLKNTVQIDYSLLPEHIRKMVAND